MWHCQAMRFYSFKSFASIPGPRSIPVLGSSWKYLPIIGDYNLNRLDRMAMKKYEEYGDLVKEELEPGIFAVSVYSPEDLSTIYKNEGKFPYRRSHTAIRHFRQERPEKYNSGGILSENNEEWWRLRRVFQKPLSRIQSVRCLLPNADAITLDFLRTYFKNGKPIDDTTSIFFILNVELTWHLLFGERLGSFEGCETSKNLIHAAEEVNSNILKTDNTEKIWRVWKTARYRRVEKALDYFDKVVTKAIEDLKNSNRKGLVSEYLSSTEVNHKDVLAIAIDLLLGGIDTTTYTSSYLMFYLGTNPEAQSKLRDEARTLLASPDSEVTSDILKNATFTRAVLKETFRLAPIATGTSRILPHDVLLEGYQVPRGTLILTQNQAACRLSHNFHDPEIFKPERWLRGHESHEGASPFLVLPFSHGPRSCIARRLAEQNLLTLLLRIFREFRIEYCGGPLQLVTPMLIVPAAPIQIVPWKL